ncbi:hypothetical protein BCV70DRAFT_187949 [Testicularia cyperi]|uniref:Rap-GAP domain-containing protein n=1 Tax=Testicularia cyperi TaxID=1882483 RepID=A0A317XSW9_9BASI|nr:hypothetical protein BCV70DRAFT_187949 [Testicularia cyperi]
MEPNRTRSPSAAPSAAATAKGSINHIFRTLRGSRSAASAPSVAVGIALDPSSSLTPITTTTLPTPKNPFESDTPASLEPVSPYDLSSVEPADSNNYEHLFTDLWRPLPASPRAREEVVRHRIVKVRALAAAVERQSAPSPNFSDDVPLADVFKLCTSLLTAEQPQVLRIEACNLLTLSVKLADKRAASASRALTELRNGAPGSLSSKIPDSDQPLAAIDRALFYRLVLTLSASEIDDDDTHDVTQVILAGLPAQLRALEVLTKEGRDVVGFPDLLLSLTRWLAIAWKEVQRLRAECQRLSHDSNAIVDRRPSNEALEEQQSSQMEAMAKLSAIEWEVQACLHLLTGILKYSFARIPLAHAEMAIRSASDLILGDAEAQTVRLPKSTIASPPMKATPLLGPQRTRDRSAAAPRSRSRDARPLVDGYSYYGLETISPSPTSDETSPSMTPRSAGHLVSLDAVASQLRPSSVAAPPGSIAAPITLTTLAPNRDTSAPSQISEADSVYCVGPTLHLAEVRSILKLLDASLRYGYLPPACIAPVMQMLCRLLGYHLVDPNLPGFVSRNLNEQDMAWRGEVWPIFSNILRSHCANAAIRAARQILSNDSQTSLRAPEDPAVLVGAVSFFRIALIHVAEQEAQKSYSHGQSSVSSKAHAEDALAPSLSLSLILPALRAALKRQCDAVDLEVLNLVADLLPSEASSAPSANMEAEKLSEEQRQAHRVSSASLSQYDWDALLDLTSEAKRHLDGLKFSSALLVQSATAGQMKAEIMSRMTDSTDDLSPPVLSMLNVLTRLRISSPLKSVESKDKDVEGRKAAEKPDTAAMTLPWTPKLAGLLLTLAPILPDATAAHLIQYFRSQHLCLPSNPDWLPNVRALLQAFFYRPEPLVSDERSESTPSSRHDLVSLIFEHVYNAVQNLDVERNLFMTEVVLPLANSTLTSETDTRIETTLRSVLVHAAVLSGSQIPGPIDPEAEAEEVQSKEQQVHAAEFEEVFVEVRKLLCRLARLNPGAKTTVVEPLAEGEEGTPETSTRLQSTSLAETKARNAALDMIAIFNRMAFNTPWIASSVDRDIDLSIRRRWEEKTRDGCIALFRDLLELLRTCKPNPLPPNSPASAEPIIAATARPVMPADGAAAGSPCTSTRLAILEWLLRFRTDRQHRVYLAGDLDELVHSSATILMRGPVDSDAIKSAEPSSMASTQDNRSRSHPMPPARNDREGREAQRSVDATARSKSRLRELSRERGRPERVTDSPRRAPGERNRSSSMQRSARPAAETLWRLPQKISFEAPAIALRSDIIYTYIHQRSNMECCAGNEHLHSDKNRPPAPIPVSEFVAVAIDILRSEPDWEIVSYLLCHLPHQLTNKHLFCGPKAQIEVLHLRKEICEGILKDNLLPKVVLPDDLKKTDVTAVVYDTLVTLISYRTLFSRAEQDDMVEAFILGLKKSQTTARSCIRALSIACYELQKSFTRFFSHMLLTLTAVRFTMTMSVHILELIATVAHHPACYANFTEADYKRVFSIVLQYIEYHQSPEAATRDDYRASPATFSLSQYVMLMAFYNISLWFVTLKISDRAKHLPYICRGLLKANESMDQLSDQTQVCFDFLARFTHSNADPKPKRSFVNNLIMGPNSMGAAKTKDSSRQSKTWLMGNGIVTVSSLKKDGWVEILIRRPSGTVSMLCKLENVPISMLPDENGEKIDLPAMLMMHRNPDHISYPLLSAPYEAEDGSGGGQVDARSHYSMRCRVQERLAFSDRLRAQRPLGPSHFGLAGRPRSASFSDSELEKPGASNPGRSSAMREMMREILGEDVSAHDAAGAGGEAARAGADPATSTTIVSTRSKAPSKTTSKDANVDPTFVALQLSTYPDMVQDTAPLLLPDEPATDRLVRTVDLTPVVDFHKIGVLYVGPGQEDEVDILSNRHGSRAYTRFLQGLGHLVTLRGQEDVYTGGLDRKTDEHGKYAYVWTDEISQIVYHTATLMPNQPNDPIRRSKKELIGNDWVHIVFNESGQEYKFGTIASQFNYVNVVISPITRGGVNLGAANPDDAVFYQVSLQRRANMPEFSPVGDGQLLSADALPSFVRLLALNSNVMSQIFLDTGEAMRPYSSNWVSRLNLIRRGREKELAKRAKEKPDSVLPSANAGSMSAHSDMAALYDFTKMF